MSQSIDLASAVEATFNGSAVEQINLNGAGVWTMPVSGPYQFYSSFTLTNEWAISLGHLASNLTTIDPIWGTDKLNYSLLLDSYFTCWNGNLYFRDFVGFVTTTPRVTVTTWKINANTISLSYAKAGWNVANATNAPLNTVLMDEPLLEIDSSGNLVEKDIYMTDSKYFEATQYLSAGWTNNGNVVQVSNNDIKFYQKTTSQQPSSEIYTKSQILSTGLQKAHFAYNPSSGGISNIQGVLSSFTITNNNFIIGGYSGPSKLNR